MAKPLIKNALVCINGSKASIQAAKYSIILAKQNKMNIKFVFVVDTQTIKFLTSSRFLVTQESQDYELNLKRDGKNYLDYVLNLAKLKGIKAEAELLEGAVCPEILKAAKNFEADLIVMGGKQVIQNNYAENMHTRSCSKFYVKNEVSALADCPVLIVHKPEIDDIFKVV